MTKENLAKSFIHDRPAPDTEPPDRRARSNNSDVIITPVDGKNGLFKIEIIGDKNNQTPTISEIYRALRKPLPKSIRRIKNEKTQTH